MSTANIRHRFTESIVPHTALLIYTVIALFPIFLVIINSFKARKAIFRQPLALLFHEGPVQLGLRSPGSSGGYG